MEQHFTIIIPAYNCEKWVNKNLKSAIEQQYNNYEIVYINDCSTDDTGSIAKSMLNACKVKHKYVENKKNKRALSNLIKAIRGSDVGTIIVALDGDDWLASKKVLKRLNELYTKEVWITAGSYIDNVHHKISRPKIQEGFWGKNIRKEEWSLSHLRTFRRSLFMNIEDSDMVDVDGSYFKFTWDRVIMYPMVEMAGENHFLPIMEVMYVYNRRNPISVDRAHRHDQVRIEYLLRDMQQYKKIEKL